MSNHRRLACCATTPRDGSFLRSGLRQSPIVPRRRVSLCRYARRYRLAYYDASKGGGADDSVLPPLAPGDALRVVGGGGEDERGAASGDNDETDDGVAEADRGAGGGGGGGDGGLTLHTSETKPPARFTEARRTRRVREREGSYIYRVSSVMRGAFVVSSASCDEPSYRDSHPRRTVSSASCDEPSCADSTARSFLSRREEIVGAPRDLGGNPEKRGT